MEGGNRRISNHRKLTFYPNWVILRTRRAHNETRLSRHCPGAASGRLDSLVSLRPRCRSSPPGFPVPSAFWVQTMQAFFQWGTRTGSLNFFFAQRPSRISTCSFTRAAEGYNHWSNLPGKHEAGKSCWKKSSERVRKARARVEPSSILYRPD